MPVQFKILNNIYSVNDHLNRFGRTCAKMAEREKGGAYGDGLLFSGDTFELSTGSQSQQQPNSNSNSNSSQISRSPSHSRQQQEMLIPSQFREASTQSCYDCCCDCCRCLCRLPTENGDRRSAARDPKSERVRERPEQRRHSVRQMPITV